MCGFYVCLSELLSLLISVCLDPFCLDVFLSNCLSVLMFGCFYFMFLDFWLCLSVLFVSGWLCGYLSGYLCLCLSRCHSISGYSSIRFGFSPPSGWVSFHNLRQNYSLKFQIFKAREKRKNTPYSYWIQKMGMSFESRTIGCSTVMFRPPTYNSF